MKSNGLRASYPIERPVFAGVGRPVASPATRSGKSSALVPLFLFALALPLFFYIGPTRMSPYRLILVVTFVPCLLALLSGSLGRIRLADVSMLLAAAWGAIVLISLHGIDSALQSAGIFVVETLGPFLLARKYIRDYAAFANMVKALTMTIIALLPFALIENVSGSPVLIEAFGKVFPVYPIVGSELRLGLRRAQGTFEYSILFGIVCSSAFALSYYVGENLVRRLMRAGLVVVTVVSSLSSGPLLSLVVQGILIGWDKLTARVARRWLILAAILGAAFIVIDLTSNRSPFDVFISYLTFNSDTSYMRVHIWNYGTESVMRHPILGLGQTEWEHPEWMSGSIDNFWLVAAVRYGIPGFVFIAGGFLAVCFGLGRIRHLPVEVAQCRKGLIITRCGLLISMCTVHVWDAPYVLILFLLGSGMWMFDVPKDRPPQSRPPRMAFRGRLQVPEANSLRSRSTAVSACLTDDGRPRPPAAAGRMAMQGASPGWLTGGGTNATA